MDKAVKDLLSFCSRVDFGTVSLSQELDAFRGELNREMLSLCEYLPESMRTKAALFLMEYLQASLCSGLNFVNYFYAPAWSILFWLQRSYPYSRKSISKYMQDAKIGHTMAMFLHALDDHLTDGQLPTTHLTLLMRSQSWMVMTRAFKRLARGVETGPAIVGDFIDDYYSSIGTFPEPGSLDCYCAHFGKQMATWLVVPVLLAKRLCADEKFSSSIQAAFSSFGIAWRLLDDIQDLEKDMFKGVHSSVYFCLNEYSKGLWNKNAGAKKIQNNGHVQTILEYLLENRVIDNLKQRTCSELESAASIADACSMTGFAGELRSLLKPLAN